jgi:hypothetical protein
VILNKLNPENLWKIDVANVIHISMIFKSIYSCSISHLLVGLI